MGRGGLERVGSFASNTLQKLGHNVHLSYYTKKGQDKPLFPLDEKISLHPIYNAGYGVRRRYKEKKKVIKEVIEKNNIDVFFVQYGGVPLLEYYSMAYEMRNDVVFGYQEATNPTRLVTTNWSEKKGCSITQAKFEREIVASFAKRVRQTMPSYKNSLPNYIHPQVMYFPNAIDVPKDYRKIISTNNRDKSILFMGGKKMVKRVNLLIEAFALIADKIPDWRLDICGGEFDYEEDYHKTLSETLQRHKNLKDRIIFHGEIDNVYNFYKKASIHVITSAQEGRPTCVTEAMAMGVPSIGYDYCPGTNELIEHGKNGLLVCGEDDINHLAEQLLKLASNKRLLKEFSDKCYKDAESFKPEIVKDYWGNLFNELGSYKGDPERLFEEQCAIDKERALHAKRAQKVVYNNFIEEIT